MFIFNSYPLIFLMYIYSKGVQWFRLCVLHEHTHLLYQYNAAPFRVHVQASSIHYVHQNLIRKLEKNLHYKLGEQREGKYLSSR